VNTVADEVTVASPRRRFDARLLGWPLLIYGASRVAQFTILAWMVPAGSTDGVRGRLLSWDGGWFVRVAREGYPHGYTYDQSGTLVGNGLAFFPGYPFLVRLFHLASGVSYETAALTVSWLAGAVAAVVVHQLGARLYDTRVGLILTALFCAQPMSLALSMAYSESLFVALVAGMLLAARTDWWLLAGLLGLGAALTRPTGAAAAVALAVAAALAVRTGMVAWWRPVVAAIVALAGVPAFLIWVGLRVGTTSAWFDIQTAGWGSTFDYGLSTVRFVRDSLHDGDAWVQLSVALMVLVVTILAFVAIAQRLWPPLLVYGLIALVLVLGQAGYYHSKPRLLVPVLLILVPPAVALARARTSTAALVLCGYAAFGLWYGAYLVTVWHYAI
jgi:hypothetical protein